VSTEIRVGDVFFNVPDSGEHPSHGELVVNRRVSETAEDRPSTDTLPALADPAVDHGDAELQKRREDVEEKHRRVIELLDRSGLDAVILGSADVISWLTAGGNLRRDLTSSVGSVMLYVNRQSRAVVTDNVQSPRVFEEELAGLGFLLKERPWHESPEPVLAGLTKGRRVATDLPGFGLPEISGPLREQRLSLTRLERQRLRELGRTLAVSVEATCRNFAPGETEADVAGHLSHRLLRQGVTPVDIRVAGDDRFERFRQPTFTAAPIHRNAIISVTGRRHGLCAAVTRIVSIGPVDPELRRAHAVAAMVDATYIYFSRPGEPVSEVFRRARRIFEKFGHPHEWTLDYQGSVIGYEPRELPLGPNTSFVIRPDLPLRWNPSVQSARSEDTIVVDTRGFEVVTEAQKWPKLEVLVKGFNLPRPGILER